MQQKYYDLIATHISRERLDAYARRVSNPDDKVEVLAYYLWNTALGQSLYPTIQTLEISVRNGLHAAISSAYGTDSWFDDPRGPALQPWQRDLVNKAKRELIKRDHRRLGTPPPPLPNPGRIIAELNFGFWVGFFNDDYDPSRHPLWRGALLLNTFPQLPPDEPFGKRNRQVYRNRRALSVRLNRILRLRNRISHHEPIWYWKAPPVSNLGEQHVEVLEILSWIDPVLRGTATLIDDFPTIYGNGPPPYKAKLASFISTLRL